MSSDSQTPRHRTVTGPIHTVWDRTLPAAVQVASGDRLEIHTLDASYGAVARRVESGELDCPEALQDIVRANAYPTRANTADKAGHPLTGPVFVEGAQPGDTLQVDLLEVRTGAWGWNACRPGGIGLLDAEISEAYTHFWDLRNGLWTEFLGVARLPLAPFPGVIGVALAEPGAHRTAPPRRVGGNMDVRQLTAGSTLFLPVEVEGALLSVGDVHAAQGDGEVSGTGIETDGQITLRVQVLKDQPVGTPHVLALPEPTNLWSAGAYVTTGHAPDLLEAARIALRELLGYMGRKYGFSVAEAYVLASACVDLRISQLVDAPNFTVSALLPHQIFQH